MEKLTIVSRPELPNYNNNKNNIKNNRRKNYINNNNEKAEFSCDFSYRMMCSGSLIRASLKNEYKEKEREEEQNEDTKNGVDGKRTRISKA